MGSACSSGTNEENDFQARSDAKAKRAIERAKSWSKNNSKAQARQRRRSAAADQAGMEYLMHEASVTRLAKSMNSGDAANREALKIKSELVSSLEIKEVGPLVHVNKSSPLKKSSSYSPEGSPRGGGMVEETPLTSEDHEEDHDDYDPHRPPLPHHEQLAINTSNNNDDSSQVMMTINVIQSSTTNDMLLSPSPKNNLLFRDNSSLGVEELRRRFSQRSVNSTTGSHISSLRSPRQSSTTAVPPDSYNLACFENSQEFSRDGSSANVTTPTHKVINVTGTCGSSAFGSFPGGAAPHETPNDLVLMNSSIKTTSSGGPLVPFLSCAMHNNNNSANNNEGVVDDNGAISVGVDDDQVALPSVSHAVENDANQSAEN